jgi:hypothetical protein
VLQDFLRQEGISHEVTERYWPMRCSSTITSFCPR